ncbi:AAA family ATPase [Oceanobacillus sp. FSL W7-1293]|uniref:AAA family ATPase n=1 Tax=unclassified Oceanobacillus TaxID=2630292 RepID=UPI0030CE7DA0
MFEQELQKIKAALKDTSDIELNNEYDALLVKPLASSNLLHENRNFSKTKQSHIALSGKASQDFFPYVDIYHYTDTELNDQSMKSFYVLQVPVSLNKKNIDYANDGNMDFNFNLDGFEEAKGSVKLSRPGASPQIELGNTSTSDDIFRRFRKLFYENDVLLILKEKKKVNYEAYIIKSEDAAEFELSDTTEFAPNRSQSTIVDLNAITPESDGNNEKSSIIGSNIIYYGAPGTGKSYGVTKEIKKYYPSFENESNLESRFIFRTTLHPEYTYSDFVGQVMPKVQGDSIKYVFTPGVFTRALSRAIEMEGTDQPVFLVLEELSRANVAAVFGDLFQLLDRKKGESEYSISNSLIAKEVYNLSQEEADSDDGNKKIYLPNNLFIYGTVNTNDQNVFAMDTAFKRRFDWKYISTKPVKSEDGIELNNPVISIGGQKEIRWWDFYQRLNEHITSVMQLGEDKQIGQFFIKFNENKKENNSKVQNKLLQYLWDDIEQASFTEEKLFENILNFSDLYEKYENDEEIFHSKFLSSLNLYSKRDIDDESDDLSKSVQDVVPKED